MGRSGLGRVGVHLPRLRGAARAGVHGLPAGARDAGPGRTHGTGLTGTGLQGTSSDAGTDGTGLGRARGTHGTGCGREGTDRGRGTPAGVQRSGLLHGRRRPGRRRGGVLVRRPDGRRGGVLLRRHGGPDGDGRTGRGSQVLGPGAPVEPPLDTGRHAVAVPARAGAVGSRHTDDIGTNPRADEPIAPPACHRR
ncbi:hypothetical protein Col01nite_15170 [Cellulomonas oligotrophica]|uniref:Uncharacterized protein n=1 Tax=Cellulomonas oligotrophica TaxID=931536 RepID=A0ABQ4DAA1_9CELL|nr:hypothetical protein Col01nite_15170 [Cellulomonas oligotrophica]